MSKKVLVDTIADKFDTRAAAERAVDAVTGGIETIVRSGEPVTLNGFGSFKRGDRAARKGRNPRTGETIDIGARQVMTFSSKVTF
jgi:DNA-binding protein HU-beta